MNSETKEKISKKLRGRKASAKEKVLKQENWGKNTARPRFNDHSYKMWTRYYDHRLGKWIDERVFL